MRTLSINFDTMYVSHQLGNEMWLLPTGMLLVKLHNGIIVTSTAPVVYDNGYTEREISIFDEKFRVNYTSKYMMQFDDYSDRVNVTCFTEYGRNPLGVVIMQPFGVLYNGEPISIKWASNLYMRAAMLGARRLL